MEILVKSSKTLRGLCKKNFKMPSTRGPCKTALWHTGFFKRPLVRRSFNNDVVRFSEMFCHEGLAKSRQEIFVS